MLNKSNRRCPDISGHKQLDFFSEEESLWHKQSKQTTSQLHEQLALLLLSCSGTESPICKKTNKSLKQTRRINHAR